MVVKGRQEGGVEGSTPSGGEGGQGRLALEEVGGRVLVWWKELEGEEMSQLLLSKAFLKSLALLVLQEVILLVDVALAEVPVALKRDCPPKRF